MHISLSRLPTGISATVSQVECDIKLRCRLRDFGLIPGTVVTVRYRSPCGGVTALECRGAVIALRTKDLRKIKVMLQ